jgi:hypothetical protein
MVDATGEAVVVHREPAATPQIWRNRLAGRGKNDDPICVLTKKSHVNP